MTDTLGWALPGVRFEDGSRLEDWTKVEESGVWHWQYDTHELTFDIYEHDGQYWKLYRLRYVPKDASDHAYDYGGQACRMALVEYRRTTRSPHSSKLMQVGDKEWVRTYEVDEAIHRVIAAGRDDPKYGAPYGPKRSAA